jgi:elongation factor P hydroxylase
MATQSSTHQSDTLVTIFNRLFAEPCNTVLCDGGSEPEYQPSEQAGGKHRIVFTRDYYASALHEVAHWCIAGDGRRQLHDYGYWYVADGRSPGQQEAFEQVEFKPQAMEWLFSSAAGYRFRLSADNLSGGQQVSANFKKSVYRQACDYREDGLPDRASAFFRALAEHYGNSTSLQDYSLSPDCL